MVDSQNMSQAEYLAFERQSEERHEFVNGKVFLKEPSGWEHSIITGNTSTSLHQQQTERECVVVSVNMRLRIEAPNSFRYPDIMVICGKPHLLDEHQDNILNPTVIVEVLSPETELDDRQTKLHEYISIESLQHYVLVSRDEARAEIYSRYEDGKWLYKDATGLDANLELPAIACTLPLSKVYHKAKLPSTANGTHGTEAED